ncbi:hypothetical protein GGX14DRAFT_392771 [Mycena pura]|uniref:Uncharacterized protein n=1 Tax=Mycena pura TaxID=153505 RepID=A0AAD6VR87_9AGAR|nr:hypothetical protein GGX14DRAFT_392771 [Mycena pura]
MVISEIFGLAYNNLRHFGVGRCKHAVFSLTSKKVDRFTGIQRLAWHEVFYLPPGEELKCLGHIGVLAFSNVFPKTSRRVTTCENQDIRPKTEKAANTAAELGSQPEAPPKSKRKRPADNEEDQQGPSKKRKPVRRQARYRKESDSADESTWR